MPEAARPKHDRRTPREIWLESLANLGKRLIAPPAKIKDRAPAGDRP